jgi:hypothetical protein
MSASAVDVFYEPDLLELLGEEPELLAIADAIAQTQTRARRRSWLPRAVSLGAAAAAAVALVVVSPWGTGRGASLVERALAAVGRGPVIHAVIESDTGLTSIDIATGRETPVAGSLEIWFDQRRHVEHSLRRANGRILDDMLQTPNGTVSLAGNNPAVPPPILDPALAKSVDGYREALASGQAKPDGDGTIGGRPVSWLKLTPPGGGSERIAIDQDTSEPVRVESVSADGARWDYDVLSIEALPEGSGDFTPPRPSTAPAPKAFEREPAPIAPAEATTVVPGALGVGLSFKGLPLTQVSRAKLSTLFEPGANREPAVSSGLELDYGSDNLFDGRPYLWIQEAMQPNPQYGWRPPLLPAPGHLLVGRGGGQMVENGIYVTILASNRELMIEAARALEPFASGS